MGLFTIHNKLQQPSNSRLKMIKQATFSSDMEHYLIAKYSFHGNIVLSKHTISQLLFLRDLSYTLHFFSNFIVKFIIYVFRCGK